MAMKQEVPELSIIYTHVPLHVLQQKHGRVKLFFGDKIFLPNKMMQ
jgi:hypothetical protein